MLASLLLAAMLTIETPAATGAAEPHLTTLRDGSIAMSWLQPAGKRKHALKFATLRGGKWSAARVIAERADFFVNWADFPSIVEDANGVLFAHWLQKSGPGAYAYDVWLTASGDGGKTWKKPLLLNTDGKQGEHGFVSMVPLARGGIAVAWLDGRAMVSEEPGHGGHEGHGGGSMMLRAADVDAALQVSGETMLDARTCECCATGMAMTAKGALVAYRDRGQDEVRDIFVARRGAAPSRVHADGWKIAGCPVNGPQIDARGERVVVAWFTAGEEQPRVHVAFSRDGGATFDRPLRIDGGHASGRVDVLLLEDGSALATWIEGPADATSIMTRRVRADGRMDAPRKVAATSTARGSGFPRLTSSGKTAWLAWTDATAKKIRVAKLD